MKVTWLGQAGLLFDINGTKVMFDPYLSDSVAKINPANKRRVAADESFFEIKPDILVLTHNHLDHTDPETLERIFKKHGNITVLASYNAWQTVRKLSDKNNCVSFNRHTVWRQNGIKFTAVYAEHSDDHAIGVVMEAEKKKYYITGDTLYSKEIFKDLPKEIDAVFLPVNGVGNNMKFADAAAFVKRIKAKKAVPLHFGLFDDLNPTEFNCKNRVIPVIYKEIEL